jgi:dipeptidyl aminopeptidase/acylaminoacyl peptidase
MRGKLSLFFGTMPIVLRRMSILQRSLRVMLVATVLAAPILRAAKKPELPAQVDRLIEVLFGAPEFKTAKLAPDGGHLAYLREENGINILRSYDFKTRRTGQLAGATGVNSPGGSAFDQSIRRFYWLGPDQLLIYASEGEIYYSGLWAANASLLHYKRISTRDRVLLMQDPLPNNPDVALLYESPDANFYGSLWRLEKKRLTIWEAEGNPGRVIEWLTDTKGAVRLAVVAGDHREWSYLYRETEKAPWRPLVLPRQTSVITFDAGGQTLLVTVPGEKGRRQLQSFDLAKSELDRHGITDPVYDIAPEVLTDNKTGVPIGLWYDADKPKCIWLQRQYAELSRVFEKALPGQIVSSIGVLNDNDLVFSAYSDTAPLTYYRYNAAKPEIRPVIFSRAEAAKMRWAPMTPISFSTRDGYTLHGYLTLPLGRGDGKRVPLVALSHGGPQSRDIWGFDEEVQFLAALGYGVLQVNYRGSTGFGAEHELANTIEVAGKSVDDVVDGIRWAVEQGYADPKKIVAYGASYGAYISIALATRYPDLPAATIGFAGVYDWEAYYREITNPWRQSDARAEVYRLGSDYYLDVRKNAERYRAVSPVHFSQDVRCPVLLYHGSLDQTVRISQTQAMGKALRDAGKTVELMRDSDAVHGFTTAGQTQTFYRSLAAFLLKYAAPEPSP